ncbi:MAG: ABC transporter permease [Armatimonadetes bacterium]|nr:ABC transporter permease [Armatimonadota bacterium]
MSPLTYLLRNPGKTLPLLGVITLAVMLIAGMVAVMNSIPLSVSTVYSYSKHYLGVTPRGDQSQVGAIRDRITAGSPVEIDRIMTCRLASSSINSIVGGWPFVVLGLEQDDLEFYGQRLGGATLSGRYPMAGEAEATISRPVAKNLGLELGDALMGPAQPDSYSPNEVEVVGIIDTEDWIMVTSVEYLRDHHFPPVDALLVFAKDPHRQSELDQWALDEFKGSSARIYSFLELERETQESFSTLYLILNIVVVSLVVVITTMMGMLINMYQAQRVQEFGLLQAIGFSKARLLRRVLAETTIVLSGSWLVGLAMAMGLLYGLKVQIFDPKAYAIEVFVVGPYLNTLPVPLMIFVVAVIDLYVRFRRFDPVAVVERRLA